MRISELANSSVWSHLSSRSLWELEPSAPIAYRDPPVSVLHGGWKTFSRFDIVQRSGVTNILVDQEGWRGAGAGQRPRFNVRFVWTLGPTYVCIEGFTRSRRVHLRPAEHDWSPTGKGNVGYWFLPAGDWYKHVVNGTTPRHAISLTPKWKPANNVHCSGNICTSTQPGNHQVPNWSASRRPVWAIYVSLTGELVIFKIEDLQVG